MTHEGEPIFNVRPPWQSFINKILSGSENIETPQEQLAQTSRAEQEIKISESPPSQVKAPFFSSSEYIQTAPTYSPRDRTRGIEGFVKKM